MLNYSENLDVKVLLNARNNKNSEKTLAIQLIKKFHVPIKIYYVSTKCEI